MVTDEQIQSLTRSVDELAVEVRDEKQARKQTVVVGAVAALMVLVTMGTSLGLAFNLIDENRGIIADIEANRASARVTSCEGYNRDTVGPVNNILISVALATERPQTRAFLEPLLLKERICTPEGIDAYFDEDPETDPFVPVTIPAR